MNCRTHILSIWFTICITGSSRIMEEPPTPKTVCLDGNRRLNLRTRFALGEPRLHELFPMLAKFAQETLCQRSQLGFHGQTRVLW